MNELSDRGQLPLKGIKFFRTIGIGRVLAALLISWPMTEMLVHPEPPLRLTPDDGLKEVPNLLSNQVGGLL
jgi:hypothetical protein